MAVRQILGVRMGPRQLGAADVIAKQNGFKSASEWALSVLLREVDLHSGQAPAVPSRPDPERNRNFREEWATSVPFPTVEIYPRAQPGVSYVELKDGEGPIGYPIGPALQIGAVEQGIGNSVAGEPQTGTVPPHSTPSAPLSPAVELVAVNPITQQPTDLPFTGTHPILEGPYQNAAERHIEPPDDESPASLLAKARKARQAAGELPPDYVAPTWKTLTLAQKQEWGDYWKPKVAMPEGFGGWENERKIAWLERNWPLVKLEEDVRREAERW